ncbi:hypothetical protein ES703_03062 [subsurface metagenome]|nr:hypothetical protein [bacterium]
MLKKLILLTAVFAIAAFAVVGPVKVPEGVEVGVAPVLPLRDDPITPVSSISSGTAVLLTEGEQAGVTTYDYQQNGAMGNRIAVDDSGYIQLCWMHSEDEPSSFPPSFPNRDIYYNVWGETGGFVWSDGQKASGEPRAGYTTMGLLSDDRAVVAFHHTPTANVSAVVVDAIPRFGAFSSPVDVDPITVPEQPIWPHIVVGADDVIHVTAHISPADPANPPDNVDYLYYSRSTDEGQTFSEWKVITQTAGSDAAIAVSKDGSKVAIAWMDAFPIEGIDWRRAMSGNIKYVESTNSGASWSAPVNVTADYYTQEPVPNSSEEGMWWGAWYRDLDCAYDAAGNLHIGWGEGLMAYEVHGEPPNDSLFFWSMHKHFLRMVHWSEVTNKRNIASGPYSQFVPLTEEGDTIWDIYGFYLWGIRERIQNYYSPGLGCWNPQLAAIGSGDDMVFTWQGQWDSLDVNAGGAINADIYAAISTNGGATWGGVADWTESEFDENGFGLVAYATNLTNTHTPGARIGDCESEEYHSVYPWIGEDSILHITYVKDLFSGSVVQQVPTGGISTRNPVMYLGSEVYVGDGPTPDSQPKPTSVAEAPRVEAPLIAVLGQHPISGSVVFKVSAPGTHASLKIYDVAGKLVETVFEGRLDDTRMLTWDASAMAAGVYFYYFVTPAHTASGRVVIIR